MDRGSKRWSVPKLEPIDLNSGPSSRPTPQQGRNTNRNSNRGSISGTAFGKSDFGVQLPAGLPKASSSSDRDRRASKRISRISKLSDVSEVESERARSRIMSGMPDDDGDFRNRRMSRKMSVADQLVEVDQRRMSRKMSMMSAQNLVVFGTKTSFMNRTLEWQQNPETLQKDVAWDDDLKKASNWTQQKKKLNTAVCCKLPSGEHSMLFLLTIIRCTGFCLHSYHLGLLCRSIRTSWSFVHNSCGVHDTLLHLRARICFGPCDCSSFRDGVRQKACLLRHASILRTPHDRFQRSEEHHRPRCSAFRLRCYHGSRPLAHHYHHV